MREQWGRKEYAGEWPKPKHGWTITTLLVATLSVAGVSAYRCAYVLTPLQQFYLKTYIRSGLRSEINLSRSGRYLMLNVVDRKGSRLALDEEVTPVRTATGEKTFALTEEALKAGDKRLVFQQVQYDNARLHQFLGHWIYRDQTFMDFLRPGLWGGLGVFCVGLLVAIPKDANRARERKQGRRLRGPELVTPRHFNRRNRSDGIGFELTERTFVQRLFGRVPILKLPRLRRRPSS